MEMTKHERKYAKIGSMKRNCCSEPRAVFSVFAANRALRLVVLGFRGVPSHFHDDHGDADNGHDAEPDDYWRIHVCRLLARILGGISKRSRVF